MFALFNPLGSVSSSRRATKNSKRFRFFYSIIKIKHWYSFMSRFSKEFYKKTYPPFSNFCFTLFEHFGERLSISLTVPYETALPDDCGIGCVAMLLKFRDISTPTIKQLSEEYKNEKYYMNNVGWKHDGLTSILQQFGVDAYRAEHQSIFQIVRNLKNEKPVIVSLRVPEIDNLSKEGVYMGKEKSRPLIGHLCVVVGVFDESILLHDPRNVTIYKDYVQVPFADFKRAFTGRCIYLK